MAVDDKSADDKPANDKPAVDSRPGWSEGLPVPKILAGNTVGNTVVNGPATTASVPVMNLNLVLDIPVQLSVELGRTKVPIKQVLQLKPGSIVELDSVAGEPVDVLVNGYLIAQGEVVVVNGKFGIRLTDVVTPSERFKRVGKG